MAVAVAVEASSRLQEPHALHGPASRPRRRLRALAAALPALALLALAAPASADRYDPQRAGHPLRIIAYALHPVGVALDYLIMRPAHWVGSHEPFATLFGHEDPE